MSKPTHKYKILKKLYDTGLHLTATDFTASNANQYLGELESQGLIIRYKVKRKRMSPFKLAYISKEKMEKVEKYLEFLSKKNKAKKVFKIQKNTPYNMYQCNLST